MKLKLKFIFILIFKIISSFANASEDFEFAINNQVALLDSKITSQFPAVGLLKSDYDVCTGTLITPSIVLTAGHCIQDLINNSNHASMLSDHLNSSLVFELKFGKHLYSYTAVTGYSFRNSYRQNDIGLILLSTAVPLKLVTPMELDSALPLEGDPITIIGYGCNQTKFDSKEGYFDADGGPRNGKKQIVYQKMGSPYYHICSGDSGAPYININSNKIFAVASGYLGNLSDKQRRASKDNTNFVEDTTPFYNTIKKIIDDNKNYCTNDKFINGKHSFIKGICIDATTCKKEGGLYQAGNCPNHDAKVVCCSSQDSEVFSSFH